MFNSFFRKATQHFLLPRLLLHTGVHTVHKPHEISITKMRNILNVAEKNDAAKNIAAIMSRGASRRRDGLSVYNKIYEFEYTFQGQKCNMIMTSVSGHLLQRDFTIPYRNWNTCNPVALFDAPVVKSCSVDHMPIKNTLEREVRRCDALIVWTDCDREGENIGSEVIDVCTAIKRNIQIYRAKFSQITATAVNQAMTRLVQLDQRVSDAVEVRSELDLRIGAAFTRFQTLRLQKLFPAALAQELVSYGSCQFPTMGFVVDRYKAIEEFVPEAFWKIEVAHTKNELTVNFRWEEDHLFDELAVQVIYDKCTENPIATVERVESKPKSKWRPVPLDTVELEKLSSRKLKITAAETMRIAEQLYSNGFISYPRTETNIFPKDLPLEPLVEMQINDPNWGEFAAKVLQDGPRPRQGKKSDQAHPPIHPTKYTATLNGNQKRIYELIVRHFLACCSKDALGHETKVQINIADEMFHASGLMVLELNYLEVYIYEKWSSSEIHVYQEGEEFMPTKLEMNEGETSPPKLLTEADLIALMEKHGIGTDATHAEHIETIKKRRYVCVHENQYFMPCQLGMGLVEGYDNMGFNMSKPFLRAELEADLKRICEGTKDHQAVLRDQTTKYKEVFVVAVEQAEKLDDAVEQYLAEQRQVQADVALPANVALEPVRPCPVCGLDMLLKQKRTGDGYFLTCTGFPACKTAQWFPSSAKEVTVTNQSCRQCGPQTKLLHFKFQRGDFDIFYPEREHTACVAGCDQEFLDNVGIRPPAANQNQNNRGGGVNGGPQGNARGVPGRGNNGPGARGGRGDFGGRPGGGGGGGGGNLGGPRGGRGDFGGGRGDFGGRPGGGGGGNLGGPRGGRGDFGGGRGDFGGRPGGGGGGNLGGPRGGRGAWGGSSFSSYNDNQPGAGGINRGLGQNGANQNQNSQPTEDDDSLYCQCRIPAVQRTVRKEGPNQGRQFYTCSKGPNGASCGFFLWADEGPPQNAAAAPPPTWGGNNFNQRNGNNFNQRGGGQRGGYRARGTGAGRGTGVKRKCGQCGNEGHNKRNCPSNNSDD